MLSYRAFSLGYAGFLSRAIRLCAYCVFTAPLLVLAQDQYEPNDERGTATQLIVGDPTPQMHTLDPDQDIDWFRFNARYDEIYDIRTLEVGDQVDLVLEVYNEIGDKIEEFDFGFLGEGEAFSFRAKETGTYYLKIYDYNCINQADDCLSQEVKLRNIASPFLCQLVLLEVQICRSCSNRVRTLLSEELSH